MAVELKTKENNASVTKFLNTIADEQKRKDAFAIAELMKKITKEEAKMWGTAIVGFGSYHYKYASGHEGDACLVGFSPRKQNLTLYLMGFFQKYPDLLKQLGKHKTGKGCLYINSLEDVDIKVLKKIIEISIVEMKKHLAEMKKKNKK
ncbi:MAG TPA: DUF1801 domain-containing protein [Bacteroidia bacterium]|nr:DUF1801 domain-containing protein [Bacteroidia bacterium]